MAKVSDMIYQGVLIYHGIVHSGLQRITIILRMIATIEISMRTIPNFLFIGRFHPFPFHLAIE